MEYLCQNGVDYEECENLVKNAEEYCSECQAMMYDNYIEEFYGGFCPEPIQEQQRKSQEMK